ncbi:hypothetical protein BJY04DRAFT_217257 [Aspergillus karnatakaensis]|uniref:putative TBP interacting domain protein n=1 Tax=Aspergillus karnatakaensis TaxID=1810916 RepID=UPI003CCD9887
MTQKKVKADNSTNDVDGSAMILDYLTYAVKALKDLHLKKEIECRVAGKQTVYHALQEEPDKTGPNAIATMDEEIQALQDQLPALKEAEKKLQAQLSALKATPLVSELRVEISKLEAEKETLAVQLKGAHGEGEASITSVEKEAAKRNWKFWLGQDRARAKICRDLWQRCSETLPEGMTRGELWESLGLEGSPM